MSERFIPFEESKHSAQSHKGLESAPTKFVPSNAVEVGRGLDTFPIKQLIAPRQPVRRLDLAVKWRLFRHFISGDDPDAIRVYLWMIEQRSGARMDAGLSTDKWKRSLEDYLHSAIELYDSVGKYGFSPREPIPIDPDGELLNGSHRVALGLALGLTVIPVRLEARYVWAPPWDRQWFINNQVDPDDLVRMLRDYEAMTE